MHLKSADYLSIKVLTTLKQDTISLKLKLKNILKHSLMLSCAAIALVPLCSPAPVKAQPPSGTTAWKKTFEDTFSNGFNTNKWNKTFWWGNGSINDGAISYYSPDNVSVPNGSLNLAANNNGSPGMLG